MLPAPHWLGEPRGHSVALTPLEEMGAHPGLWVLAHVLPQLIYFFTGAFKQEGRKGRRDQNPLEAEDYYQHIPWKVQFSLDNSKSAWQLVLELR